MKAFQLCSGPLIATALIAAAAISPFADAQTPAPGTLVDTIARANLPEFFDMLALPNDAINPADVQKNAAWMELAFQKRGFATKLLPNNGKPLVYAEFPRRSSGAKTILFYMHFDGQPVIPEQWSQKSPWTATLKQRTAAGEWKEIDRDRLLTGTPDPEWRLFARSASDDKGPIMMFLNAFDAMKAAGMTPVINVKVLLDSEEEKNSPGIGTAATANRGLLRADAFVINDGPLHESNQPTLVFGNRGDASLRLTVYGARSNLHSGHYGNYAPNPAQRLAGLLASMKDDDGHVLVAGYYDNVKLSAADRAMLAAVPDDETALRRRLGIAKPETVGRNYQEALQYPTLNIRGLSAAAVGDKTANIIPGKAVAELEMRTVPGTNADYLIAAIERHIRSKGYYLSKGEPSDDERAKYDKIASILRGPSSRAVLADTNSAVGKWAETALAKTFAAGGEPARIVRIRMSGATLPTDKLADALQLPFVTVPLVNGDNNQHSFDENIRVAQIFSGTRAFIGLLTTPF